MIYLNQLTLFILVLLNSSLQAFSLKNVTSWWAGHQEKKFHEEILFESEGTLTINHTNGAISIKTWSLPKIVIEAATTGKNENLQHAPFFLTEESDELLITTTQSDDTQKTAVTYEIMVPAHLNIIINAQNSPIKIKRLQGNVAIALEEGTVDLQDMHGSIDLTISEKGSIAIGSARLIENDHIIAKTKSGTITIHAPKKLNTTLYAKTERGMIYSDHVVSLHIRNMKLNKETWRDIRKEVIGTIGNGTKSFMKLYTENGNIKLLIY